MGNFSPPEQENTNSVLVDLCACALPRKAQAGTPLSKSLLRNRPHFNVLDIKIATPGQEVIVQCYRRVAFWKTDRQTE